MKSARQRLASLAISTCLALVSLTAHAQELDIYYKIGGARPVSGAASGMYSHYIGVNLFAGGNFSCGKFNLKESVSQALENVKRGADEFQQAMVQAAQSAIASLPMLMLQRMNPGLYDIFQNALLAAKADVNIQVATCRQMENDIANGRNPYANWIRWGDWSTWQREGGQTPNDALGVGQAVRDEGGRGGVPWMCTGNDAEFAGGVGQRAIEPIRDATIAGYNIIAGRAGVGSNGELCSLTPAPHSSANSPEGTVGTRLGDSFATPEAAADFITQVIGDTFVYTYRDAPKRQRAGTGVLPYVERESQAVVQELIALSRQPANPTSAQRALVRAPNVTISNQLINSLKNFDPQERIGLIRRLADEIAVSRVIDRLLLARRMLLSARDLSVVRNSPAVDIINDGIEELRLQTEELVFETRTRRELVSETALQVIGYEAERRTTLPAPVATREPPAMEGGGVRRPRQ